MKSNSTILTLIFALSITLAFTQDLTQTDSVSVQTEKQNITLRHSIGSSMCLFINFGGGDPARFGQLNYGYKLTPKNNIVVEAATWNYYGSAGPYNSSDEKYPGKIRAYGIGAGYQRFLWKNAFTSLVATPFLQQYIDEDNKEIQKGLQLYLQFTAGYRFEFFKKSCFLEPAASLKYWPVNTNLPESFKEINDGEPNYEIRPRIYFGYQF